VFEQQTVQVPDMAHEQRWPRFAAAAAEAGAASMLSFQLYVEKDNLGALNLYVLVRVSQHNDADYATWLRNWSLAANSAIAAASARCNVT
jgi:hypothetical protein